MAKAAIDMTPAERHAFLAQADNVAVVCAPTADGGLVARVVPYRAEGDDLVLDLVAAADLPQGPGAVALVDSYPTYEQIKGVMLRGALVPAGAGRARLDTEHASGFDFAKIPKPGDA